MNPVVVFLAVLGGIVVLGMVVVLIAVLLGVRTLRNRNRVSPVEATDAPLTWLASPMTAARLHRRLRSAMSVVRMVVARHAGDEPDTGLLAMTGPVEQQALAVDRQLTVVARLAPADRRRLLPELVAQVEQLEQVVSRLSVLDARSAGPAHLPGQPTAMEDLASQLDHIEAARKEIDEVELRAGVVPPATMPRPPDPERARRPG